jgi:nucleotide-binding universal stress UspA family protein
MKNILVPLDASEPSKRALETALALASDGGQLTLLHVIPPFPSQRVIHFIGNERIIQLQSEDAMETMAPYLKQVEQAGVPYSMHYEPGIPDEIIGRYAAQNQQLVVMGTHGYGRISGFLLGSVSYPTLQRLSIPLILVPEEAKQHTRIRKILIAVDGSEQSRKAASAAIELGRKTGAEFILLNVVAPPIVNTGLESIDWVSLDELEEIGKNIVRSFEEMFIHNRLPYTTKVAIGDPAGMIREIADETNADLIAMGHRGNNRLAGLMLGSVAYKVIHGTKIPVLITK